MLKKEIFNWVLEVYRLLQYLKFLEVKSLRAKTPKSEYKQIIRMTYSNYYRKKTDKDKENFELASSLCSRTLRLS